MSSCLYPDYPNVKNVMQTCMYVACAGSTIPRLTTVAGNPLRRRSPTSRKKTFADTFSPRRPLINRTTRPRPMHRKRVSMHCSDWTRVLKMRVQFHQPPPRMMPGENWKIFLSRINKTSIRYFLAYVTLQLPVLCRIALPLPPAFCCYQRTSD